VVVGMNLGKERTGKCCFNLWKIANVKYGMGMKNQQWKKQGTVDSAV
jgi:hypothetical protein